MGTFSKVKARGVMLTALCLSSAAYACSGQSKSCNVSDTRPYNASTQSTSNVYGRIFAGQEGCIPDEIVLRLPDNYKTVESVKKLEERAARSPEVLTIITTTGRNVQQPQFYVRRVDYLNGVWTYTRDDSCLAWVWEEENDTYKLVVTLERNLEIFREDIEKVAFIVSLPVQLFDTRNPAMISVQPYTYDRVKGFRDFDRGYRTILSILKYVEGDRSDLGSILGSNAEETPTERNFFSSGVKVGEEMSQELDELSERGGIHYQSEFESILETLPAVKYQPVNDPSPCAIPSSLIEG